MYVSKEDIINIIVENFLFYKNKIDFRAHIRPPPSLKYIIIIIFE